MPVPIGRLLVRVFAIVVALIGVWLSHHLILQHLSLSGGGKSFLDQVCVAFATSSCADVLASPWGTLTIGGFTMPTAQIGQVFFLFILCWFVLVGEVSPDRRRVHLAVTLFTATGLGICILLGIVMFTTLPTWCPLCTASHLATLLVFFCLLLLWPAREPETAMGGSTVSAAADAGLFSSVPDAPKVACPDVPRRTWPTWRALVMVPVVTLLLAGLGHVVVLNAQGDIRVKGAEWYRDYWIKQYQRYDNHWQHTLLAWSLSPQLPLATEGEPARGPEGALHTIVLFSDFQCPSCARLEEWISKKVIPLSEQHGGTKVIFKHWPICTDCNPHAARNLHPHACLAARAAEAARLLGGDEGFWQMHDLLFANNKKLKDADEAWFVMRARQLGFPASEFLRAMNSDAALARITANIEEGQQLGRGVVKDLEDTRINATPAVFVNNRMLRTWRHLETWRRIFNIRPTPPAAPKAPASEETVPGTQAEPADPTAALPPSAESSLP